MNLRELNTGTPSTKTWLTPVVGTITAGNILCPDITDLNSKTQNISLADTVAGLTVMTGQLNTDRQFTDNGSDNALFGMDLSAYVISGANITAMGGFAGTSAVNASNFGYNAGSIGQGAGSVAIGVEAGLSNQGIDSVAVGHSAGGLNQGTKTVAVGRLAGDANMGINSVAIGHSAGSISQHSDSIILNATGAGYQSTANNQFRLKAGTTELIYDASGFDVKNTTTSTTATTGSIIARGGVGIVENLNVGGASTVLSTTVSTSPTTGAFKVSGGAGIVGTLWSGLLRTDDTSIRLGRSTAVITTGTTVVAIGDRVGETVGLASNAIAIGSAACRLGALASSVVVGRFASELIPASISAVIIGNSAGRQSGGATSAVLIGADAGNSVGLGTIGDRAVCIGEFAGSAGAGAAALCIGSRVSSVSSAHSNSILINANGTTSLDSSASNQIRMKAGTTDFTYDATGFSITNATASTTTTTGALKVSGGVGIVGNLNVGGTINNLTAGGGAFAQTNTVTVANTVVETSLMGTGQGSLSVPANTFTVGGSYIVEAGGVMSCLNNETLTIRIYGGATGTTLLGTVPTLTISTTTGKWWGTSMYFTVRTLGVAGVASLSARVIYSQTVDVGNNFFGSSFHTLNTTTFDTTLLNTLRITAQWGTASASNTIAQAQCVLTKSF